MTMYYSKLQNAFYSDDVHDTIPPDAVEISDDQHAALIAAQAEGQVITAGSDGPVAEAAPVVPPTVLQQILALEAQQTPRRCREAMNGTDNGWMKTLDAKIATLRAKLPPS